MHRGFNGDAASPEVAAHSDNYTATYSSDSLLRRNVMGMEHHSSVGFAQNDFGRAKPPVHPTSAKTNNLGTPLVGDLPGKIFKTLQTQMSRLESAVHCVRRQNEDLCDAIRGSDRVRTVRSLKLEWQNLATMIDRACFILFFIAIVSSLIWLFPRPAPANNLVD